MGRVCAVPGAFPGRGGRVVSAVADLYRKSALERISSPEQLDQALEVTSPLSWPALIGIGILLAAILFFWPIPVQDTVSAMGTVSPDGTVVECCLTGEDYEAVRRAREVTVLCGYSDGTAAVRCRAEQLETGVQPAGATVKVLLTVLENGVRMDPEVSGGPCRITVVTAEKSVRLISLLFG